MKNNPKVFGGIILFVIVIFGLWFISVNNSLNKKQQAIEGQWGQVENQMQRRSDLTPQLVSAVKGNMKHEDKVFSAISDARKQYSNASTNKEQMQAMNQLQKQTAVLVNAVHENYPKLASSNQVNTLMTQLEGSENRLSQERRTYNQKVQSYNTTLVSFPTSLIAKIKGMHNYSYYKSANGSNKAPKVDLE